MPIDAGDSRVISIYSWNVNGVRAAVRKGFMDWYNQVQPDITCLQETRSPVEGFPKELRTDTGTHFTLCEAEKKGYSGVATISRLEPVSCSKGLNKQEFDSEGRVICTDYGHFLLYNVYFPNGTSGALRLRYKLDFYETFLQRVSDDLASGKKVIICGDVNTAHKEIDLARPRENSKKSGFLPEERAWIDRLLEAGFCDALRLFDNSPGLYTWWDQKTRARDRNIGWRIDYFFISTNLTEHIKQACIHADVMGSDHCPISIQVTI